MRATPNFLAIILRLDQELEWEACSERRMCPFEASAYLKARGLESGGTRRPVKRVVWLMNGNEKVVARAYGRHKDRAMAIVIVLDTFDNDGPMMPATLLRS